MVDSRYNEIATAINAQFPDTLMIALANELGVVVILKSGDVYRCQNMLEQKTNTKWKTVKYHLNPDNRTICLRY